MKKLSTMISVLVLASTLVVPLGSNAQSSNDLNYPDPPTDKARNGMVQRIIAHMSDKEKIGQLVMPSTHDNQNQMPDERTRKLIEEYNVGSVIVYGDRDAKKTAEYNNQLQGWASQTRLNIPLFISADLEYGSVQHVSDGTAFPRQMGIGATRDLQAAEEVAKITAIESKATGFNWNYSPVADVNTNPANPVIGVRSFSEKTELVSDMTKAQIKGYQDNGVLATAKHFPGHGDTSVDSHYGLAAVTYDRETLEEVHLPPFKAAIDAGIDSIMTAHVIINAIDPELPATLSKKVLTGLLREEMGFDGIIVTDAMSMHAIDKEWGAGEAGVMAINAGADIVMATGTYEQQLETYDALYNALKSGDLTEKRVDESIKRILTAKFKYDLFNDRYDDPATATKVVNTTAHKEAASEVARKSITLLKNDGVLPFETANDETTLVVGPKIYGSAKHISEVINAVDAKTSETVLSAITETNSTNADIANAVQLAEQADRIIVATFSPGELAEGQVDLVQALKATGKPVVALSLGLPYDIKHFPEVDAYLASYAIERWGSPVPTSWNAAVDVIFGAQPGGRLPVNIEGFYQFGDGLSY
ncbi:glycoside hydrolase family 3 protein [Bacillus sp. ISL-39]|uniref:glycoside hydrolase family 3 protein n=1 Tax=Bacillus sp. ISL-39 TaxID=2819124 RepID=UPI001BE94498|nr:glycoside hydrolase family 3 protein [Bacillus sp. ISL-39]MBT2638664.1 glycoside hydrolase family 3 C-terminal domain-containing protein [Bacillus sp. ISL-39]